MRIRYRLHVNVSAILAALENFEATSVVVRTGKTETKPVNLMMKVFVLVTERIST